MPGGRDPRRKQFVVTLTRELYEKFMQKNSRLGLKRNDSINMLIGDYADGEVLEEARVKRVQTEIQAVLDKRGWDWSRIGKPRGPGKKTLAREKEASAGEKKPSAKKKGSS